MKPALLTSVFLFFAVLISAQKKSNNDPASKINVAADKIEAKCIAWRRDIHEHPELAFEKVWTAATLAGRMRALGFSVRESIGGTGVLACSTAHGRRPAARTSSRRGDGMRQLGSSQA